jgi:hypothetical protein
MRRRNFEARKNSWDGNCRGQTKGLRWPARITQVDRGKGIVLAILRLDTIGEISPGLVKESMLFDRTPNLGPSDVRCHLVSDRRRITQKNQESKGRTKNSYGRIKTRKGFPEGTHCRMTYDSAATDKPQAAVWMLCRSIGHFGFNPENLITES